MEKERFNFDWEKNRISLLFVESPDFHESTDFPLSEVGRSVWGILPEIWWYTFVLIMVIELSGVQFGLKSYAWFQNWTSLQREFDLKWQVWFQTKIALHLVQLPLYYIHFEIAEFSQNLVTSPPHTWWNKAFNSLLR